MAQIAKVKNPASALMLVNPGGFRMTRTRTKRKVATNRAAPVRRTNTRAKRRTTNPRRRNSTTIYAAARPAQAVNRRRRNRVRNPSIKGLVTGSLFAAAGAMAQTAIAGIIPWRPEGIMGLGVELGIAYLTSMIGERFLSGQNAMAFGLGAAGAFGKSALNYALGLAQSSVGALSSALPQQTLPAGGGVNDIVAWRTGTNGVGDIIAYN